MQDKIKCFCNEWIIDNVISIAKGHSVCVSLKDTPSLQTFQIENLDGLKQQCYNIITSHLRNSDEAMSLFNDIWFVKVEPHILAVYPTPREEFCGFSVGDTALSPICGQYKDSYIIHIDIKEDLTITIRLLQVHKK